MGESMGRSDLKSEEVLVTKGLLQPQPYSGREQRITDRHRAEIDRKKAEISRLKAELSQFLELIPLLKETSHKNAGFRTKLAEIADYAQQIEAKINRIERRCDVLKVVYQAQMLLALRDNDIETFHQAESNFAICTGIWGTELAWSLQKCGDAARKYIAITLEAGESSRELLSAQDDLQGTIEGTLDRLTMSTCHFFGRSDSLPDADPIIKGWQQDIARLQAERLAAPVEEDSLSKEGLSLKNDL